MVQPLIQPMVKKMRITGNFAKRKRDKEESSEEDRDLEAFSNETNFVEYVKFVSGEIIHLVSLSPAC